MKIHSAVLQLSHANRRTDMAKLACTSYRFTFSFQVHQKQWLMSSGYSSTAQKQISEISESENVEINFSTTLLTARLILKNFPMTNTSVFNTRWLKYDRDKLWLVYTQIVPVKFEPPCIWNLTAALLSKTDLLKMSVSVTQNKQRGYRRAFRKVQCARGRRVGMRVANVLKVSFTRKAGAGYECVTEEVRNA